LLTTLLFTVVFGNFAKIPTDGKPAFLFYLCGMLGWQYFSQCLNGTSAIFVNNAQLFGKVYFPRIVVPLSVIISNLAALAIQFATFLCFWLWFKFGPQSIVYSPLISIQWQVVFFPLLILQTAAIGLGVGLWMSALTAKYRDFTHLSAFIVQLWMFASPVPYAFSAVPEKWRWLMSLNPLAEVIESCRYMFLGSGTVAPLYLFTSIAMTLLLLLSGFAVFSKIEKTFIDTV
jgi:lipopolysaccharide transport system permease protein